MDKFVYFLHNALWGTPTVIIILLAGIILSFKTKFIQVIKLKTAFSLIFKRDSSGKGLSSFACLCTSLSASIGTGNILGVGIAIGLGGPGALFWMLISAFFGMALKFAEGVLAVKYRSRDGCGVPFGGPFLYIEKGLTARFGFSFKPIAIFFALCTLLASLLGLGTMVQSSSISFALGEIFHDLSATKTALLTSILTLIVAAIVIFKGDKAVARVSKILVPFMTALYIGFSLLIIVINYRRLFPALWLILKLAFNPKAAIGGGLGWGLTRVMSIGVSRGIFSNESGLGTAPIAAASGNENHAVKQGLVLMTGTFIDTFIVCFITGLCIVMTVYPLNADGFSLTSAAWIEGLPFSQEFCVNILCVCLIFFAFTTVIGWNFYGEKCLIYLHNDKRLTQIFRICYLFAVAIGPFLSPTLAFLVADIFNGLMALPNVFALIFLSREVKEETQRFLKSC